MAAQQAFRPLEQAWLEGSERERQDLDARLTRFVQIYPNDMEVRQVQVWLAWLRLSEGRFDEALSLAEQASANNVGSCAEAAEVVKAAVATRRGQPQQSLRILEPLSGQIIDAHERDSWAREIILAALRLKHDDDALKWALAWRLESSEDSRSSINQEIGSILDQVSQPALDRLWSQLAAAERIPTTSASRKQGRVWMREALLQRLARFAIDKQDSALARRLLNDAWLTLQKNSSLKRLARVAAQGDVELQSLNRTIGVILDLGDARKRRSSSELLTGVLQTLDDTETGKRVFLRTREASLTESKSYAAAVEELYNEGVGVLVGGFDEASATELAKKARMRMLPVITLSKLAAAEQNELSFWIDTTDDRILEAWNSASHGSLHTDRVVSDADPFCTGDAEAPFERWRKSGVERVLVACEASCAGKLGQAASDSSRMPAIWLGPKAVAATDSWRSDQVKGTLTFERLATQSPRDDDLRRWQKRHLGTPNYYEVLGRDVTLLAASGLSEITTQVPSEQIENRLETLRAVAMKLGRAHVSLWCSESNGFSADHSLVPNFAELSPSPNPTANGGGAKPRNL